jgi:hypothetical protein
MYLEKGFQSGPIGFIPHGKMVLLIYRRCWLKLYFLNSFRVQLSPYVTDLNPYVPRYG